MSSIKPYSDAADSIEIGELTIENNVDRVSLYGSIQLTRDKVGLQQAKELKAVIDAVIKALEADKHLPDEITLKPTDKVDNPFK